MRGWDMLLHVILSYSHIIYAKKWLNGVLGHADAHIPSNHKTFVYHLYNVGPTSKRVQTSRFAKQAHMSNFHTLDVVCHCRDPQHQVGGNLRAKKYVFQLEIIFGMCMRFHNFDFFQRNRMNIINMFILFSVCNCNAHATQCTYDEGVDELSMSINADGIKSGGGVCIECGHNTTGKCEQLLYQTSGSGPGYLCDGITQ